MNFSHQNSITQMKIEIQTFFAQYSKIRNIIKKEFTFDKDLNNIKRICYNGYF